MVMIMIDARGSSPREKPRTLLIKARRERLVSIRCSFRDSTKVACRLIVRKPAEVCSGRFNCSSEKRLYI